MIKFSNKADKEIPGTVQAVVARRYSTLEASNNARGRNQEKVTKAGQILNHIHRTEVL